ncbi:hypothetical protein [Acerihabitans arboris]|nr:hypothetical protein [Acerihabitans arboris]
MDNVKLAAPDAKKPLTGLFYVSLAGAGILGERSLALTGGKNISW